MRAWLQFVDGMDTYLIPNLQRWTELPLSLNLKSNGHSTVLLVSLQRSINYHSSLGQWKVKMRKGIGPSVETRVTRLLLNGRFTSLIIQHSKHDKHMNKTDEKNKRLVDQPKCPTCGCRLVVLTTHPHGHPSHEAVLLKDGSLLCYGCHRVLCKQKDIANMSFLRRMKKRMDIYTGIPSAIRFMRSRINQFVYLRIKGNKPNGRKPSWYND